MLKLRSFVWASLSGVVCSSLVAATAWAGLPTHDAPHVGVRDVVGNRMVYETAEADPITGMGSVTKVMTIYVALDAIRDSWSLSLPWNVVISDKAASQACTCFVDKDTLQPGDHMTMEDLLYATALSHGEPTVTLAEVVANTVVYGEPHSGEGDWLWSTHLEEKFIELMNAKAQSLGLSNTVFSSVHGGDPPAGQVQYSSTEDLTKLWAAATAEHPDFMSYVGMRQNTFEVWRPPGSVPMVWTLTKGYPYYSAVDGDKNGGSAQTGSSLLSQATRINRPVVVAIKNNSTWTQTTADATELFRYGFEETLRPVRQGDSGSQVGATDSHAIACAGSNRGASAVRTTSGKLKVIGWNVESHGAVSRRGGAEASLTISSVQDVVLLDATRGVAAVLAPSRTGSGWVHLVSFALDSAGYPTVVDSRQVRAGSLAAISRVSSTVVALASRNGTGYLSLDTWSVGSSGELDSSPLASYNTYDAIDEVSIAAIPAFFGPSYVATASRRNTGALRLRLFRVDPSSGSIDYKNYRDLESARYVDIAAVGLNQFAVSSRNAYVHIQLDYFDVGTNAFVRVAGSQAYDQSGPFGHQTSVAPVGTILNQAAVVAFTDASGDLELAVNEYKSGVPADQRWLSDSGGVSGAASEVRMCELTTSAAEGAYLTGLITESGTLKVLHWRVGER